MSSRAGSFHLSFHYEHISLKDMESDTALSLLCAQHTLADKRPSAHWQGSGIFSFIPFICHKPLWSEFPGGQKTSFFVNCQGTIMFVKGPLSPFPFQAVAASWLPAETACLYHSQWQPWHEVMNSTFVVVLLRVMLKSFAVMVMYRPWWAPLAIIRYFLNDRFSVGISDGFGGSALQAWQ